jgi:hypothetical protein
MQHFSYKTEKKLLKHQRWLHQKRKKTLVERDLKGI